MDKIIYTGTSFKIFDELNEERYDAPNDLVEAVNLAIFLEQPLLLMGEPGCGKTRLAEAVAIELHGKKWRDHFFRWDIKSTTKAKDGIYQIDSLKRMYDATSKIEAANNVANYISYGAFAKALEMDQNESMPNILLIDEIDKADIDFPNDLLLEIEKGEYTIAELDNKKVVKKNPLLIFVTSNRERELPPAFLRRCIYFYINFPSESDLIKIVNSKFKNEHDDELVKNAVALFLDIRKKHEENAAENDKKPSTSELLNWFRVLHNLHERRKKASIDDEHSKWLDLIKNYKSEKFADTKIPFQQLLLKTYESLQLFQLKK